MRGRSVVILLLLLGCIIPQNASAEGVVTSITTDWQNGNHWIITTSDGTHTHSLEITHSRNGEPLEFNHSMSGDRLTLDTDLQYGDVIEINAGQLSRTVTVGNWNQPLADHEVTKESNWQLSQDWQNENGTQIFKLVFNGRGWQSSTGNILNSWEMGNGTWYMISNTENDTIMMDLSMDHIWRNETVTSGLLTSQVFMAEGSGDLEFNLGPEDERILIDAEVNKAQINRSVIDGIISESMVIDASGNLNMTSGKNESFKIDADLSSLYIEYQDVDGVRLLDHSQIEATGKLQIIDGETRVDLDIDRLELLEKWQSDNRIDHLYILEGDGTFGLLLEEGENASVLINGTVIDFKNHVEDGKMVDDALHVNGVISGDATGTFGLIREVEGFGTMTNHSGVEHEVIVIHQEEWRNITALKGITTGSIGNSHNESWHYDSVWAEWQNRTIKRSWQQTGPDPSTGEEKPENSPIQVDPEPNQVEDALGDVNISRESGLAPIPAISGDTFSLNGLDGVRLLVTTTGDTTVPIDGHNLDVVSFSGQYSGAVNGSATGTLVNTGPVAGLVATIERSIIIPLEEDVNAWLNETSSIDRILSPSVVSSEDNSAPTIVSISLREGHVYAENGGTAALEVEVADIDFNIERVYADLSPIGGASEVELTDRGLDGDLEILDDVWTTIVSVPGLVIGEVQFNVTVVDLFGAESTSLGIIEVSNPAPRLLDATWLPTKLKRGQQMVINAQVYDQHGVAEVAVDMRDFGGQLSLLTLTDGQWTGMITIPDGMIPGKQLFKIKMTDSQGASTIVTSTQKSGKHGIDSASDVLLQIQIENEAPTISNLSTGGDVIRPDSGTNPFVLSVAVDDPDGVYKVQVRLSALAPIGEEGKWFELKDDGQGGDEKPGDGIYSLTVDVRAGLPAGSKEVLIRANDVYGLSTGETSYIVSLKAESSSADNTEAFFSDPVVLIGIIGLLIVAVAVFLFISNNDSSFGDD